jgi:hypothetical protein
MEKTLSVEDIDETPVLRLTLRKEFMSYYDKIRLDIHGEEPIARSYEKAEMIFILKYGGRCFANLQSFNRTLYYHIQSLKGKPKGSGGVS